MGEGADLLPKNVIYLGESADLLPKNVIYLRKDKV